MNIRTIALTIKGEIKSISPQAIPNIIIELL
jgi:hypothetical protein